MKPLWLRMAVFAFACAALSLIGMIVTGVCGYYPSRAYDVFDGCMLSAFMVAFLICIFRVLAWVFTGDDDDDD